MATSAEIAQQIADQNNWFLQQNAMAAQVGVNPQAYGGMGGWGVGMPSSPAMQPAPGQHMPGAFNFGGGSPGYGFGNRMQAGMAAGLSAVPMIGTALHGGSAMFNPAVGFMAARGAGLGFGASLGAAGLMAAPVAAAGYAINAGVQGIQQQSMLNTAIGNYNFANPASMSGQGFSRMDAQAIGRQVRSLSVLPELMSSFEEITRILPQLKNMGVMQGARDAAEFGRRMREAITTVRDVSKVLGTTMEDATAFFQHSRSVGFFGRQDQLRNALNAQTTMSITGMNQQQVMQLQQRGAAFGTALGGSQQLGVQGIQNMADRLGLAANANPGLQRLIQNVTGKGITEGGLEDASMSLLNLGQQVAGSSVGRFLMAGFSNFGPNGEVTLDQDTMRKVQTGELSMDQIRSRGQRLLSNRQNAIRFQRRQTTLGQQFASQGGAEGVLSFLQGALGDSDSAAYVLQSQFGATEGQADLVEQLLKQNQGGMGDERRMVAEMVKRNALRRQNGPQGMMKRWGVAWDKNVTAPLADAASHLATYATNWVEEILTDVRDDAIVAASEQGKKDFIDALGSADPKQALARSFGIDAGNVGRGSASLTTRAMRSWTDSDLYATFNSWGATGTGRSTENTRRTYGEWLGIGDDASAAAIKGKFAQMEAGFLFGSGKLDGIDRTGINVAAQELRALASENGEYGAATSNKQFEMAREAVGSSLAAQSSIRNAMRVHGVSRDEAITALVVGANNQLKGTAFAFDLSKVADVTQSFDPTAVAHRKRAAESDFRENVGADNAAIISKNPDAMAVLEQAWRGNDQELKALINKGDVNGVIAKMKEKGLKVNLSSDELAAVSRAMQHNKSLLNGDTASGLSALDELKRAGQAANVVGARSSLSETAKGLREGFSNDKTPAGKAMAALAAATEALGSALGTEAGEEKMKDFQTAIDQAAQAVEGLSEDQRRDVMGKLSDPVRNAVGRRIAAKKGLDKLAKRGLVTAEDITRATGLDAAAIQAATGIDTSRGGGTKIQMTSGVAAALEKAAASRGAGALLMGDAVADKEKSKEDQQLTLLRTMTEAIVSSMNAPDETKNRLLQQAGIQTTSQGKGNSPPSTTGDPSHGRGS